MRVPTDRPPTHPGVMLLEEFILPQSTDRARGPRPTMHPSALASRLGISEAKLNEIVLGKAGITADLAQRLENIFGMSATFWMNLQAAWDQYTASIAPSKAP